MEATLIRSKYKMTRVLFAREQYAALQAVDIESREKREYLLNAYEGALSRQYAEIFEQLKGCPEYVGLFIENGTFVSVFEHVEGQHIDSVFFKGAEVAWLSRMTYAQELFHLALRVCSYPAEVACAAFLSDNLKLKPTEERLKVSYAVVPMDKMNQQELIYLLTDQVKKVFLRRFSSPTAELAFLDLLEEARGISVPILYASWLEWKKKITKEYEAIDRKPAMIRPFYIAWMNLKRWIKKRFSKERRARR